jgi:hypothetical protein
VTTASKRLRELRQSFAYGPAPSERDILWVEMRSRRLEKELNRLRDALAQIAEGAPEPSAVARKAIRTVDFS